MMDHHSNYSYSKHNYKGKVLFAIMAMTILPISIFYLLIKLTPDHMVSIKYDTSLIVFILCFIIYAYLSCLIGMKTHPYKGNKNLDGVIPEYAGNGFIFWLLTTIGFIFISSLTDKLYKHIYENFICFLFYMLVFGYLFCIWLAYEGYNDKNEFYVKESENEEKDFEAIFGDYYKIFLLIFRYYRGIKFHPTIMGVQVKQLINCRLAIMLWQILILIFYFYSVAYKGDKNNTLLANIIIQSLYIGKFFYWETGYFHTLDITLDRAGFYICWGCIFILPSLYSTSGFIISAYPYNGNNLLVFTLFLIALICLYLNYYTDKIKYDFQMLRTKIDKKEIQSETIKEIPSNGKIIQMKISNGWKWIECDGSKLLLNSFWRLGRHINYTFELITTFISVGLAYLCSFESKYLACFAYFILLFILLVHRTGRDDRKCSAKYGELWKVYKSLAPYKFIPYII
jgi:7-dehydrocholesterol reductase